MSVGPRILFTRFVSGDSPKLQPWISHLRRLVAADGQVPPVPIDDLDNGAMVWQLVSGNNRQLARSVRVYSTFEDALAGAKASRALASQLEVALVSEHHRGVYGWYASIDGEPLITCSRWYDTERDRFRSINLAIPSLAAAVLLPGARLMSPALMHGSL